MAPDTGTHARTSSTPADGAPSARWALASLSLAMVLASLGTSIANVALPTLTEAFSASFQDVLWVVLAYLVAVTTAVVGIGRLGDIVGRRRLLLAGITLFTLSSIAAGAAPALWLLIAARAAQGLGAAAMLVLTLAFVADTVPKASTGRAMGLLATMSAVGTALGPTLGGLLIAGVGWRAIFLASAPLGALTLLLAHRHLPAERAAQARAHGRFDGRGTLVLALTLTAYTLALTLGRGSFGPLNIALLLAAAGGLGLFGLTEARAAIPLIRLELFRDRALSASLGMSSLVATVMMATLVAGPFYLARTLALDAALVGVALSAGPIVVALTGIPAGRLADRFGAPRVTVAGLAVMATGAGGLAVLPTGLGIAGYLAPIIVLTSGYALFQTANTTAVMGAVAADRRGVTSGLLNLSRNLGLITGAAAMGAVFAFASGADSVATAAPAAVATGMRITFAVAVAVIAIALVIAARGRVSRTPPRSVRQREPGPAVGAHGA